MRSFAQTITDNWVRVLYAVLIALAAVCTAVVAGKVVIPPGLQDVAPYAGLVGLFITTAVGVMLPNVLDQGKPNPGVLTPAAPPIPAPPTTTPPSPPPP